MSTHIPTTPTIYEFSTGIDIEWLPDNRWCSKGFTVAWRNNTFGNTYGQLGIPAGLDAAIRNRQFEVRAPEPEVAVVGRVVQHQGDPEIWAVVAVVSNALDKCGRGLPLWRYFCCACNDLTNANLELIRLLGRLDAFNATYGSLPAFDPQTLSGNQSDLDQIHPANRPTSEPKTPQYLDALNETNTVILPLVLDSGTCCSYHQLLALAATIACYQNRLMSWAWNVADVWDPEVFVVLQMAAGHQLYRISTPSVGVVDGHLSTSSSLQQPSPVQKKSSAIPPISALQNFEATLQQLSLESPVNPKTVAKLDQLLRQDPSINNPSVLRPIFKRLGVEANQRSFILYRDRLTEPEQVRLITFWPLLDPQMIPEYWKWCNAFSSKSEQRQISQTFQNEIKPIVSQFPTLEVSVGEDLVMRGFTLLQEGKISGTELAQQLTDTNSLFAPAPDVLCQTLGKRLTQVAQECHLQIWGQIITQSAELVTDPYWTELNNYIRQWFLKKNDAARLGITHPLFVPQGSGGNGEALFSRGWNSWVNLREGFEKASEVFKLLGRLQQVLKALPTPIPCEKAYKELRAFLSVVCQKNALFSDFQPLQTFLNDALQPTTPVNRFELRVRVIGYILKPIVGLLALIVGLLPLNILILYVIIFLLSSGQLKLLLIVVFPLLCLILISQRFKVPVQNPTDAYFNRGLAKYNLGDNLGAIVNYNKAIELNPNYAHAYNNRGLAKYELGDNQGAIVNYNKAIELNPNYTNAYYRRGLAKSDLGDNQGAIVDYDKAIELNPNYTDAYFNRGLAKYELGDNQGAIVDYNKAIELNPNYAHAYNNRGLAKYELGDNQGAIVDYNKAIELNPNYAHAYNNRGLAKYELGDNQGAIVDYDKAIELNSNYAHAYYNRGLVYQKLRDKQQALADFREAARVYQQQGNTTWYQNANDRIRQLGIVFDVGEE